MYYNIHYWRIFLQVWIASYVFQLFDDSLESCFEQKQKLESIIYQEWLCESVDNTDLMIMEILN